MGFEVAPEPVTRRRSLVPATFVALVAAAVVGFGLVTGGGQAVKPTPAALATEGPTARATPAGGEAASSASPTEPALIPARLPGTVVCNDASASRCQRIVTAAIEELPADASPVIEIDVWMSLLCRDTGDCPTERLMGSQPLGSAVVSYGPGRPTAWINVVEPDPEPAASAGTSSAVAWVIR